MNDFLYIFSSLLFCQNTGPKCRKYETVQPHVGRRTGKWEYRLIKELASKDSRRWRYTFRIALSTMSALRRSLRAGFAAAKRVTAVNAVGAAGPARAILAGSLRTQVRSDSSPKRASTTFRSIGRRARVDRRHARTPAGFSIEGRVPQVVSVGKRRGRATRAREPSRASPPPRGRWGRGAAAAASASALARSSRGKSTSRLTSRHPDARVRSFLPSDPVPPRAAR